MRGTGLVIASIMLLGCRGKAAAPTARASDRPAVAALGDALPTKVLGADPDLRWAVMCQDPDADHLIDSQEVKVFTAASPRTPIATLRGFVAGGDTHVLGVVGEELVVLDTVTGAQRSLGPAWRSGHAAAAAFSGHHLLVGADHELVLHDLATEGAQTFDLAGGRVVSIERLGARFLIRVAQDTDGDGVIDESSDAPTSCGDPLPAPSPGRAVALCPQGDVARACHRDAVYDALLDPATAALDVGGPDRFVTTEGTITYQPEDTVLIGAEGYGHECSEVLAVHDEPFGALALCDGWLTATSAAGYGTNVEYGSPSIAPKGTKLASTVRSGRLFCLEEVGRCFDLVEGRELLHVGPAPIWAGDRYALVLDDQVPYAVDLAHDGRWIVDGARARIEHEDDREVSHAAGDIVAFGDEVIDLGHHAVISRGDWEIHAVRADGTALVTTTGEWWYGQGPLRAVPPGTFE